MENESIAVVLSVANRLKVLRCFDFLESYQHAPIRIWTRDVTVERKSSKLLRKELLSRRNSLHVHLGGSKLNVEA